MTTFSQKDHQFLLVGKTGNVTTAATTINALANGEIGIFTPAGVKLTESAAGSETRFVLAVGRGSTLTPLVTPVIDKNKVTAKGKKATAADAEQLDYVGYNTSSGSIEVNNNSVYRIAISMRDVLAEGNHGGVYIKDAVYKSDASATQGEIAVGLVNSAIANFSREASDVIKFEVVLSDAATNTELDALGNPTGNLTVIKGTKQVTMTDTQDLAAGDYLRFSASATEALSDPAYRIASVDSGTVITLATPYQGTTNAAVNDNTVHLVPAAQAAASDFGIKMTGIAQPFTVGKVHYKKVRWNTTLSPDSFGATAVTRNTSASEGIGQYEQIASLEWFLAGNNGEFFRMGEPNIFPLNAMTVSGVNYDTIDIEFEDGRTDSLGYVNSPKRVTLAVPSTTPDWATSLGDDITDVLEVLLYGAAGGELAI